MAAALDEAVAAVVASGNCSGCGACTMLDPGLQMRLDESGYTRPVRADGPTAPIAGAAATFARICPGRRVVSPRPEGARTHPTMGPVVSAWQAWAADPEQRHRGSSGGALTALVAWLIDTGEVASFTGARADPAEPSRTVAVAISSRDEALAAAGSRYAPVATLSAPGALDPGTGLVGKPCEVSAARALLRPAAPREAGPEPLLLSFFCAGTPSQHATDTLIRKLGLPEGTPLADLWYRGRGWPGRFTAEATDGRTVSTSYDESWGDHLGKATQWRCKVCPDGVGESSDIAAADYWHTDAQGYPIFTEADGCSALLARTPRGHDVLTRAFEAGVIVGRPLSPDALAGVQPLQVSRRSTLAGRLLGARVAGRGVPRYTGFGLLRLALGDARQTVRTARGAFRRVRGQRPPQARR